jgi:hypothetical protein
MTLCTTYRCYVFGAVYLCSTVKTFASMLHGGRQTELGFSRLQTHGAVQAIACLLTCARATGAHHNVLSPQALAAHHSDTPGFRVAYRRRAKPLQPPLRPNRIEMRDATFCFCPTGYGAHHSAHLQGVHDGIAVMGYPSCIHVQCRT